MRFFLADELLLRVPDYVVGVVVARFAHPIDTTAARWIAELLAAAQAELPERLAPAADADAAGRVRSDPRVAAWRTAMSAFGINPNRYPSSIEALATRVLKGGRLPSVTSLVDLANAVALRQLVPLGAHDLAIQEGDLGVRLSRAGDTFVTDDGMVEAVPPGEPVYANGAIVRTRRWVWRQAANGRISPDTRHVFFPIDGFRGSTDAAVLAATQDLADLLGSLGPETLTVYRLDRDCRAIDLDQPGAPRAPEQEQAMTIDPSVIVGVPDSAPAPTDDRLREVLERGVEIIEVRPDLEKALRSGRKLRIKLGIDPTGKRIHIGRAVTLRKMRQFQRLGHHAVLIVGDLTAQVGDASGHNEERPMLTEAQVRENMRDYAKQMGLIVDLDEAELQYNSSWLDKLTFKDVIGLASNFTAAQMIQRENFRNRWEGGEGIGMQELLYPLMQGYDSFAIEADVELGGTDQLFNVMAGRKIQEALGQHPQNIVLTGMVMGLDGRKMSTSWGNTIAINDAPVDQYGKIMSINDEMIAPWLELCTELPLAEVRRVTADLASGHAHPKEVKKLLAHEVVTLYHGADAGNFAQSEFERVFEQRSAPSTVPSVTLPAAEIGVVDLLLLTGQAPSKNQARRVIEQGGVEIDDQRISEVNATVQPRDGMLIKFGRRSFVRLDVH